MIGFFEFHKAHSEILLTACADQLFYNLSSGCVKHNTAVKTVIDDCYLFAKETFSDLVGQLPSSLIITLNSYKTFYSLKDLSKFFCEQWLIAFFYKSTINSNCILLSCHVHILE